MCRSDNAEVILRSMGSEIRRSPPSLVVALTLIFASDGSSFGGKKAGVNCDKSQEGIEISSEVDVESLGLGLNVAGRCSLVLLIAVFSMPK